MTLKMISVYSSANKSRLSTINKIEVRDSLVKAALDEVVEKGLVFGSKKRLLIYVAQFVSAHEHELLARNLQCAPELVPKKNVTVGGLYKSETYMARVDFWIINNPAAVINKNIPSNKKFAEIRLKLSTLSNQIEKLKLELYKARNSLLAVGVEEHAVPNIGERTELTDAYFVIDALLLEFGDFIVIDEAGISINNSLRRLLVGAEPLSAFLQWRGKVIKQN